MIGGRRLCKQGVAAPAETASTSGLRSNGNCHRQTEILRSGASRNWLLWIARARTACQQSSGEFSSAASTTRTKDARFHGRHNIGASSRLNRRHDPLPQVLRVSSAHHNPLSNQQGKRITNEAPLESQRDSTRRENALDRSTLHSYHVPGAPTIRLHLKGR